MTTLPETGMAPTTLRNAKTTMRDGHNRPIVVVTGMGVITSLGEGKTENWKKLTAGELGISTIRRFSTHGLKTRIAGTIDFVEVKPFSSTTLAERLADIVIEEALSQSGIGRKGYFPVPLFSVWPGRSRVAATRRNRPGLRRSGLYRLRHPVASQRRRSLRADPRPLYVRLRCGPSLRDLRHKGIAHFGIDGLRVGRNSNTARRRGNPARRSRRRAVRRDRRLHQCRSHGAIFSLIGAIYSQRRPAQGVEAFFKRQARIRDG